jgi:hypothetical protein
MSYFYLYEIFEEGPAVSMSEEEMAEFYEVFVRDVRLFIQNDVEAGFVIREGKSNFYLSREGLTALLGVRYLIFLRTAHEKTSYWYSKYSRNS